MPDNLARHTRAAWTDGFWRLVSKGLGFMFFDLQRESFDRVYERLQRGSVASLQALPSLLEALVSALPEVLPLKQLERP